MALLRNRLPFALGSLPSAASSPFVITDIEADYAVGGIPFLSAAATDRPYQRQTAPYRKEQFDTGADPGEQSIVTWWLRSQSSFHGGSGQDYEVAVAGEGRDGTRFSESAGVDVWTPGKVKLLKRTAVGKSATGSVLVLGTQDANGVDSFLQAEGTALHKVTTSSTALTWGGAGTIRSLAFDGARYYAADSTGIYRDTLPTSGAGAGAILWNTGNASVVIGWVKQRLVAAIGPSLYELVGGAPPTLPAAKYTHPLSTWTWTAFAEGPAAIYVAGYSGTESTIVRWTLGADGALPTLTSATEVARMPRGEIVTALLGYLGTFLLIGTNRGVRVAVINDTGGLTYGPPSVLTVGAVNGFTAKDRFVFATVTNSISGKSGLVRVDLAEPDDTGRYPYANDLVAVSGNCAGVTQYGGSGRLVIGVDGAGSYVESATLYETLGSLTTERIRFHTLDRKVFKYIQARVAEPLVGTLAISQVDERNNTNSLISYGTGVEVAEVAIAGGVGPQAHMRFTFTLAPNEAGTGTPEFHGYQLKALPAAKRQRQFVVPLYCFDHEKDGNGITDGHDGWSYERLVRLEALEETGDTVLYQDFTKGEARLCVIDDIKFLELSPPTGFKGNGGVLLVTLRAVT